uniref:hypothetical protein n=1 Tax=Bradyrhizobium sp. TaxID=376 RepID=UPI0025C25939|nr:hypothetical protein [Bradyrhizobium sp.]
MGPYFPAYVLGIAATISTVPAYAQSVVDQVVRSSPVQIGPPGGGLRVGPIDVDGRGRVRVRSPAEVLDDELNRVPGYALLSDADKRNVKSAVVTTGVVAGITTDPAATMLFIKILSGQDGKEKTASVKINPNTTPTGKAWNISATCIVQQEAKLITAYFNTDTVPDADKIADGDTVNLTAPICPLFKDKSVTSVTINKNGFDPIRGGKPPEFTYVMAGKPAA